MSTITFVLCIKIVLLFVLVAGAGAISGIIIAEIIGFFLL
jgi:hypothetical protein